MSRSANARSGARRRRRTPKKKPRGWLGGMGRWCVAVLLVSVVVLFLASFLGLFGRQGDPQREEAVADWEIPSHRLTADLEHGDEADRGPDNEFATRVSRWAEEVRGGERRAEEPTPSADADAGGPVPEAPLAQTPVRVHLANGCGVNRLAASLTDPVREGGFDVCGTSNADRTDYTETLIIDRSGDRQRAEAVCDFFQRRWGVGRVLLQTRSATETEVLVVLGHDLGARVGH